MARQRHLASMSIPPPHGKVWLVGGTLSAAITAAIISMFYRPSAMRSAVEIDQRFGLRERVSSALQLDGAEKESPVGLALLNDAATKVERIEVRDHFPIRSAPQTPWVALPVLSCIVLFWVPDRELPQLDKISDATSQRLNNIKNQTKPILEMIKKKREDAEEKGLQEAADEFKKIEKKLEDFQKSSTVDSKKMLSDFNEIKKEIERKKESMGGSDSVKKALDNLKSIDKGPAEKIADALKDGNFEKAGDELEKMLNESFQVVGYDNQDHEGTKLIYIEDTPDEPKLYIWQDLEVNVDFLEDDGDDNENDLFVDGDNENTLGYSWIIYMPDTISFDEYSLRALVDSYRYIGKKYTIEIYTP